MVTREELAGRIADGVAGQLQLLAAQQMLDICDESIVQMAAASVAHSTRDFHVVASAKPTNWPEADGKRVDIALTATGDDVNTWYGVVEVKYVSRSVIAQNARLPLLQDCARLAAVETNGLNAKILVSAFSGGMLSEVFTNPHQRAAEAENQRVALGSLLHLNIPDEGASVTHENLLAAFAGYQDRVPRGHRWNDRGLTAKLLVRRDFYGMGEVLGTVCCWQIGKQRGPGVQPEVVEPEDQPAG